MEQIAAGVWHTHAPGKTLPPYEGTECYWVGDGKNVLLVDCGDGGLQSQAVLQNDWEHLGRPTVVAVLLTHRHPDHIGGCRWAQAFWQCPLWIHPDDRKAAEAQLGQLALEPVSAGQYQVDGVSFELLHAPGHTPGQLNLWFSQQRLLLAGDNVLGNSTSVIAPPDGDLAAYMQTLQRLLALHPAHIGCGHGALVEDGEGYLRYYLAHRRERSAQILQLLQEGKKRPSEIAAALYRDQLPPEQMAIGIWMVKAQLAWMTSLGEVRRIGEDHYEPA
ncbi:MAG: MBL fold metallo-hydrolase [Firmicutes bacterium]|nr:MBL fold metallo-hydrolase [Bacillota bacterium]